MPAATGAGAGRRVCLPPGLIVRGDAKLLRIALDNLLGNAWKFSGNRSPARIEFGMREEAGERSIPSPTTAPVSTWLTPTSCSGLFSACTITRISRHRSRPGHGATHHPQARRPDLGTLGPGSGRQLPLHFAGEVAP